MYQQLLDRITLQAEAWITDGYIAELRCIRHKLEGEMTVQDATITFAPPWASALLDPRNDMHLAIEDLVADQHSAKGLPRLALVAAVRRATEGRVELGQMSTALRARDRPIDFNSEVTMRDRWSFPLHLQVQGDKLPPLSPLAATTLDDHLRQASAPFDGLADLSRWLNLNGALDGTRSSAITVNVLPPIELLFAESRFENGELVLRLRCTATTELDEIRLGALTVPSTVAEGRLQIADSVSWQDDSAGLGYRTGEVGINAGSAVSVLILLSYKGFTVVRQWFHDPSRSKSARHLSMIQFDPELKGLRAALFTGTDSREFEKAVGCVAYLVGLAGALPLQSRTPDLVATTPRGRQLVIECTLATSDFSAKIGKLVDRCTALRKSLAANGLATADVIAVLVCRQPSDQIASDDAELRRHRILLVAGEALERALVGAWMPADPDAIIDKAMAAWSAQQLHD